MSADIVLNDKRVDVVGGSLRVGDDDSELIVRDNGIMVRSPGGGQADIVVETGEGSTRRRTSVTSGSVTTDVIRGDRMQCRTLRAEEMTGRSLELGWEPAEGLDGDPGRIVVLDARGGQSVVLDGASGDVVLDGIGSLVKEITRLRERVQQLENRR